jgi:uncharacterized protein (DUF3084 family)
MASEEGTLGQPGEAHEVQAEPGEIERKRRESAVEARENAVEAREETQNERMETAQGIRAAADERDVAAGARDAAADKREHDLDRAEMLTSGSNYGAHWPERRNAGIDRAHAKDDRTASHADRIAMTETDDEHDPVET